jgi:hypothetical protein
LLRRWFAFPGRARVPGSKIITIELAMIYQWNPVDKPPNRLAIPGLWTRSCEADTLKNGRAYLYKNVISRLSSIPKDILCILTHQEGAVIRKRHQKCPSLEDLPHPPCTQKSRKLSHSHLVSIWIYRQHLI